MASAADRRKRQSAANHGGERLSEIPGFQKKAALQDLLL
jgi:hypothetical protein